MNIPMWFFISLGVAGVGGIIGAINLLTGMRRAFKSGGVTSIIVLHVIAAAMYVAGGLAAIGFGIAWIVTYLKH